MAVEFPFVQAFLCERVLQEKKDDVLSAIRLVDAFVVPKDRPQDFAIEFTLVGSLKSLAPIDPEGYRVAIMIVRSTGERAELVREPMPVHPQSKFEDPSIPWGLGIIAPIRMIARNLGTGYLEIHVNETLITSVPFTLLESPAK